MTEYLYLDESQAFEFQEQTNDVRKPLIGGFLTTSGTEQVKSALEKVLDVCKQIRPNEEWDLSSLRGRDLRKRLIPKELNNFRAAVTNALANLNGVRYISCHYVDDCCKESRIMDDGFGVNRFLRMWLKTVVYALAYQPRPGENDLHLCTAQRSVKENMVPSDQRQYVYQVAKGNDLQCIHDKRSVLLMLLLQAVRAAQTPFPRSLGHVDVYAISGITQRTLNDHPVQAGLILADLVCDLVREAPETIQQHLDRIPYCPKWIRYQSVVESILTSKEALDEAFEHAMRASTQSDGTDADPLFEELLASVIREKADSASRLRRNLLEIAKKDLDEKDGGYRKSQIILGQSGLRHIQKEDAGYWEEQTLRLALSNHLGRDTDQHGLEAHALETNKWNRIEQWAEASSCLCRVAVSYQDHFDYGTAIDLIRPRVEQLGNAMDLIHNSLGETQCRAYGVLASNAAQSLAYRQADGDLDIAKELMRKAREHFCDGIDLQQWACHAGNLAGLCGDNELLNDSFMVLFDTNDAGEICDRLLGTMFSPTSPCSKLFSLSMVTRLACSSDMQQAVNVQTALQEPNNWLSAFSNLRSAYLSHPLELYARHLMELCPEDCIEQENQALNQSLMGFGGLGENRIFSILNAGTLAIYAKKLMMRNEQDQAVQIAQRCIDCFLTPFRENEYCSTTTYCQDYNTGWFFLAVSGLQSALEGNADLHQALENMIGCYRYEFR